MIEEIRQILKLHEPETAEPKHRDRVRAAVLIPLIDDTVVRILLTERADSLAAHGGEVALPGGREDEDDESKTAEEARTLRQLLDPLYDPKDARERQRDKAFEFSDVRLVDVEEEVKE